MYKSSGKKLHTLNLARAASKRSLRKATATTAMTLVAAATSMIGSTTVTSVAAAPTTITAVTPIATTAKTTTAVYQPQRQR